MELPVFESGVSAGYSRPATATASRRPQSASTTYHFASSSLRSRPVSAASFTSTTARPASAASTHHSLDPLQKTPGGSRLLEAAERNRSAVLSLLDDVCMNQTTLEEGRERLRSMAQAVSIDSSATRRDRFQLHAKEVRELVAPFPALRVFVQSIIDPYDKYIEYLCRESVAQPTSVARGMMEASERELLLTQRKLHEAEEKILQQQQALTTMERENAELHASRKETEEYLSELRTIIASISTNVSTHDAPNETLLPHDSRPGPFLRALRRMTLEIETLRKEKEQLVEMRSVQLDESAAQSETMASLQERTNTFQQQIGTMKATIRVMKRYLDSLEAQNADLMAGFFSMTEYREQLTAAKLRLQFSTERTAQLSCAVSTALSLRAAENMSQLVSPVTPSECVVHPRSASGVPSWLKAPVSTPLTVAFLPMSFDEVRALVGELLSARSAQCLGKHVTAWRDMHSFLAEELQSRYSFEQSAVQVANSLRVLTGPQFFGSKTVDLFVFHELIHDRVPLDTSQCIDEVFRALRSKLGRGDLSRSQRRSERERVSRVDYLRVVRDVLPNVDPDELRSLAQVCCFAQDRQTDDAAVDAFFDRGSIVMGPLQVQLAQIVISLCRRLHVQFTEEVSKIKMKNVREQYSIEQASMAAKKIASATVGNYETAADTITIRDVVECWTVVDPAASASETARRVYCSALKELVAIDVAPPIPGRASIVPMDGSNLASSFARERKSLASDSALQGSIAVNLDKQVSAAKVLSNLAMYVFALPARK